MSLFGALSISASGLEAQRRRAELLVENLANIDTTRTPEGGPYRRKDAVFSSSSVDSPFGSVWSDALVDSPAGVQVDDIIVDSRPPEKRYVPGHPDADPDGYVSFPRVHPAEEMVNLMSASRGYEANVSAMTAVKEMIHRSLDLLK